MGMLYGQHPAPPSNQQVSVFHRASEQFPHWLGLGGEFRTRVEGFAGGAFRLDNDDGYMLARLRINLTVRPSSWMKLFAQGQDAQAVWAQRLRQAPPYQSKMHLRQAYVELGNITAGQFGLRVGRQELAFGEERLIGPSGWLNTPRYFDAVRASFKQGKVQLDAIASSVIVIQDGPYSKSRPPNNLHGLYGAIDKFIPNAVVEPYLLWRLQRNLTTERGTRGNLNFKAGGVRWAGNLPRVFDYSVEVLREQGRLGTDGISAWGAHVLLGRTFAQRPHTPRIFGEYNFASGDADPTDGRRETFDSLYPTGHDRWGLADQIGWRNIHHLRFGAEYAALPKLVLKSSYHNYWLASATDGLYAPNGALVARIPSGNRFRRVGQEIDVQASWAVRSDLSFSGGFASLMPGSFLQAAAGGAEYRYPFAQMIFSF